MWRAPLRLDFDCVAQPTIKQAPAAATARLRRFGIGSLPSSRSRRGQAIIYKNSLGLRRLIPRSLRERIFLADINKAGYHITAWSLALTHSCNTDNGSP